MKIEIDIDDNLYPYLRKYRELKRSSPSKIFNSYIREQIVNYIIEVEKREKETQGNKND